MTGSLNVDNSPRVRWLVFSDWTPQNARKTKRSFTSSMMMNLSERGSRIFLVQSATTYIHLGRHEILSTTNWQIRPAVIAYLKTPK
jgi:hypothetical protein